MFLATEGVKYGNAYFEGTRRTKFVPKERWLFLSRLSGNEKHCRRFVETAYKVTLVRTEVSLSK